MSVRSADTAQERGLAVTALINADPGPSSPPPHSRVVVADTGLCRDSSTDDLASTISYAGGGDDDEDGGDGDGDQGRRDQQGVQYDYILGGSTQGSSKCAYLVVDQDTVVELGAIDCCVRKEKRHGPPL